ncbi:MAG: hypothetical protein MJ232_03375 [archaeon]|nr:hypothetical protein [archaeon]
MWEDLGKYIEKIANEQKKEKVKIVEIGVGKFQGISNYLKDKDNIELIMVDINPANENIIQDDIFTPNLNIYKDTDILFSIRPPFEIQEPIMNLRDKLDCLLIIKPLFNEDLNIKNKKMKLKNYGRASFFIYPNNK